MAHSGNSLFPDKRRTDAIFSVESSAFLCDPHSVAGVTLRLAIVPDGSRAVTFDAICGRNRVDVRKKPIAQPENHQTLEYRR